MKIPRRRGRKPRMCVLGQPGIGKSEVVRQQAKKMGMLVIIHRPKRSKHIAKSFLGLPQPHLQVTTA